MSEKDEDIVHAEHWVFVRYSEELAKEWSRLKWLRIPRNPFKPKEEEAG